MISEKHEEFPMEDAATLKIGEKNYDLPTLIGSESERAVDIRKLRAETGYVTLDSGFGNTGSCRSSIGGSPLSSWRKSRPLWKHHIY
jgi:hypothetical protein